MFYQEESRCRFLVLIKTSTLRKVDKKVKVIDEKMVFDNEIVKASLNYFSMAFARQF